eukprot:scaffold149832_cov20-Prasinocladus_malaysianus.AAC.1
MKHIARLSSICAITNQLQVGHISFHRPGQLEIGWRKHLGKLSLLSTSQSNKAFKLKYRMLTVYQQSNNQQSHAGDCDGGKKQQ